MAEKDIVMNTMEELKEELLRTIECYYIVDEEDRRVICGNTGLISLCGQEIMDLPFPEALKGSPLLNLFVQERPESNSLNWELALEGTENYLLVRNRWVELNNRTYRVGAVTCAKDIIGLSRELSGLTLQYQEVIQQNRELLQDLQWSAFHDHLTRLGNRNKYIHDSETIFAGEAKIGILNLDINNLKLANDRYGHDCGDRLIRQVGSALKQLEENGSSYAYRVGGDEFLLICRNCPPEYPDLAADQILEMIRESNRAYGIPPCEIAVGTALREPGQSFADLGKLADDRMYVCKMQMKATGYSG